MQSYNVHSLRFCHVPLCVRCSTCDHRAVFEADELGRLGHHDMTPLYAIAKKMRCKYCRVLGRECAVEAVMPKSRDAADAFMKGAATSEIRMHPARLV